MTEAFQVGECRIELDRGDITAESTDAIVNAANPSLMGGGGVDGAIHRAGGPSIKEECKQIVARQGRLAPGRAVITAGGNLNARHVIHTVGPVYHGKPSDAEILASAYRESLRLASAHGLTSVAFPSISTGAYGYPVDEAAAVAVRTVAQELQQGAGTVKRVRFTLFDQGTYEAYAKALEALK